MRRFFPVEELARDDRFNKTTMRDRMADPRTAMIDKPDRPRPASNRLVPSRPDASDAARALMHGIFVGEIQALEGAGCTCWDFTAGRGALRPQARHVLLQERIIGVETGACPHTAVREDPSMNLAAVEDMERRFPDSDVVLIESGGDNLTLTFSPALVDYFIYVIDVAAGDKIPRKNGPGITHSDILVINKTDLAPYVGASLEVMEQDSRLMRGSKPFLFTNCKTGEGISELVELIEREFLFDMNPQVGQA